MWIVPGGFPLMCMMARSFYCNNMCRIRLAFPRPCVLSLCSTSLEVAVFSEEGSINLGLAELQ
uniref:Uncharacterized protein n=1 Tax=Anguilla anguilla TaxID=7936 RepID=A0A0E9W8W7_ANGAN